MRFASHYVIETALLVICLGLRRGAFRDYSDLDTLLAGKDRLLRWHDALLDTPFFHASTPRGTTMECDKAMSYEAFRLRLKATCQDAGLGGAYPGTVSMIYR